MAKKYKERVPAEPFAKWLQQRYEFHYHRLAGPCDNRIDRGAHMALAEEIGWLGDAGVRKLYRYRHMRKETMRGYKPDGRKNLVVFEQTEFPRKEVEDALHFAGVRFYELYPQVAEAEDIPLEPDMMCWGCKDFVTPIFGECPWCAGRWELMRQDVERAEDRKRNRLYRARYLREREQAA